MRVPRRVVRAYAVPHGGREVNQRSVLDRRAVGEGDAAKVPFHREAGGGQGRAVEPVSRQQATASNSLVADVAGSETGQSGTTSSRRRCLEALGGLGGASCIWPSMVWAVTPSAPPLLLAEDAPDTLQVAQYLVSEKLDGVRACWDGRHMLSRTGHVIAVPPVFASGLPGRPLDGELWMGRGRFEAMSGLIHRTAAAEEDWADVRYMVFELPGGGGSFEDRWKALQAMAASGPEARFGARWQPLAQRRLPDRTALEAWLAEVVGEGGEGLMLHRADAPYLVGRNEALLKLKPLLDAEGVVVAHRAGRGRFAGMLGALEVRLHDGRVIAVGTGYTEAERRAPPAIGSVITFTYRGLTRHGVPRHASFLRIRGDALPPRAGATTGEVPGSADVEGAFNLRARGG